MCSSPPKRPILSFFFFNDTATTEIYTLSYTTLFRSHGEEIVQHVRTLEGVSVLHVTDRTLDRKSTRLNSSHGSTSYAVFCLRKIKHGLRRPSRPAVRGDGVAGRGRWQRFRSPPAVLHAGTRAVRPARSGRSHVGGLPGDLPGLRAYPARGARCAGPAARGAFPPGHRHQRHRT